MHIYLSTSKRFYPKVAETKSALEAAGHHITPPNGYNDAHAEAFIRQLDAKSYMTWKADMLRRNSQVVAAHDAVLVLNFDWSGHGSYIGGATFLEAFKAFELGKKLYLYNAAAPGPLYDEIMGFDPTIIHGDLSLLN